MANKTIGLTKEMVAARRKAEPEKAKATKEKAAEK